MALFDSAELAPADPILGLTDAFRLDPRPEKINLGVGVFVDDSGRTPVLQSVRQAEQRLAEAGESKSYLPITGAPSFASCTQALCFAPSAIELGPRLVSAQTPGGTGGLRVAGDLLAHILPKTSIWLPDPTWANHRGIFTAAGLPLQDYPYFDAARNGLDRDAFFDALKNVPAGDVVLLHACCHNPTGADLSADDWKTVATIAAERGWLPLLDFAYQGFGDGLDFDAGGVRTLAEAGVPLIVAQSFSKNFGLYQDRVGALHILCDSVDAATRVGSQLKVAIRVNYSNPPAHGGAVVSTILTDPELEGQWREELSNMRSRINDVRDAFVRALREASVSRDFGFLNQQRGMFSFTGIQKPEVKRLREEFAVYMVESGRINVAGITSENLPRLVAAIKQVLG